MFTFSHNDDDELFLTFTSATHTFTLSPNFPVEVIIADSGKVSTSIYSDDCWIAWDPKEITYSIGIDTVGILTGKITNTPEILQSLKESLQQWNEFIQSWD